MEIAQKSHNCIELQSLAIVKYMLYLDQNICKCYRDQHSRRIGQKSALKLTMCHKQESSKWLLTYFDPPEEKFENIARPKRA